MTVRDGKRCNTSRGHLDPARARPNLTIETHAHVARVLFDGNRATGVEYRRKGSTQTALAGEVILSGGAINSPQLLELSGIGQAERLEALGIGVRNALPGVGENLQDHLEVYVQQACSQPVSLYSSLKWYNQAVIGLKWYLFKTGIGASNQFEETREIFAQPAFDALRAEELQPGADVQSDEDILEFVRNHGESAYHPSCTCAMGSHEGAVVDGDLRVHGIDNLRVVDASVMPTITNGNLNAPTIMIAEKAADLILGNSPLEPMDVPWYRHASADQ